MAEPPGWLLKQITAADTPASWPPATDDPAPRMPQPKWLPPPPDQRRRPAQASVVAVKTKLCHRFVSGKCINNKCTFAHGEQELRRRPDLRKTKLCEQWLEQGVCRNGSDCTFAHGQAELQSTTDFYKTTLCPLWKINGFCESGAACRHAHGQEELRARPDRIPPPPESRFSSRTCSRDAATPPPPGGETIPSPPAYPPPSSEPPVVSPPPPSCMGQFIRSASYSENDYLPRPAAYARAKRGQRTKAASFDRWRNQRRPPPPPPPPLDIDSSTRTKHTSYTRVPPPPLQDDHPPPKHEETPHKNDWPQSNKQTDRDEIRSRRASMIELKQRRSQQGQWPRNNSVTGPLLRRQRRQSVICLDRFDQKPAAVDAYPLAAMASSLVKPRRESEAPTRMNDDQVATGVPQNDGSRVCRGLPLLEDCFPTTTPLDEACLFPPIPASRGFVLLPAGWFAPADLRAPAALTAWFLPPGVRCPVAYSKPVKATNTAACLWPCSEWAESTILSTDIPPSSNTSIYS